MRGGNGTTDGNGKNYPDSGWLQQGNWKESGGTWYVDYGTLDNIADGLWGTNAGVTSYDAGNNRNYK